MHRSIFAKTYLDDSIKKEGYTTWSSKETRVHAETLMAEYENKGPGFSVSGRKDGKIGRILTASQFEPYSSPEKVFQGPVDGKFGNTAWIDKSPAVSA